MQNTATIIAHIMFKDGAILNCATVVRTLDRYLDAASNGAYSLAWDSDDVMVAEFGLTKVILVAGHQIVPKSGFSLTIAVSPKDADAISDPVLLNLHNSLIQDLVAGFEQPLTTDGVLWQRTKAPISAEAVERIAEALTEQLARMAGSSSPLPKTARSIETAQVLPASALTLQSAPLLPI